MTCEDNASFRTLDFIKLSAFVRYLTTTVRNDSVRDTLHKK